MPTPVMRGAAFLLMVACPSAAQVATPDVTEPAPLPAPNVSRPHGIAASLAPETTTRSVAFAVCLAGSDFDAQLQQRLVALAVLEGNALRDVDVDDVGVPSAIVGHAWVAVAGAAAAQPLPPALVTADNVRLVTVGACHAQHALFATRPLRAAPRPSSVAADALDAIASRRRAEIAATNIGRLEATFSEEAASWFILDGALVRISLVHEGWVECEQPSPETGDSVCGSSDETKALVALATGNGPPQSLMVTLRSGGC